MLRVRKPVNQDGNSVDGGVDHSVRVLRPHTGMDRAGRRAVLVFGKKGGVFAVVDWFIPDDPLHGGALGS